MHSINNSSAYTQNKMRCYDYTYKKLGQTWIRDTVFMILNELILKGKGAFGLL